MVFFKINNKEVASPKEINISYEVLDKTERTLDGTLVVDVIAKKKKLDISWEHLTKEAMAMLVAEVNTNTFQDIAYRDTLTGELTTLVGKVKDFSYSPGYDWVHNKVRWQSINLSIVEK